MPAAPSLVSIVIVLGAFVAVRCNAERDDDTRVGPLMGELAPKVNEDAGGEARVPGLFPLPANATPQTEMPPSSCGGLLGSSTCDPVTAWPCNIDAGETCEYSNSAGAFRCYLFPSVAPLCGFCNRETDFCGPGLTCGPDRCERFCCADSDCGQGTCLLAVYEPELAPAGVCVDLGVAVCGPYPGYVPPGSLSSSDAGLPDAGGG